MADPLADDSAPILALDIGGTKIGWALVSCDGPLTVAESGEISTLADEGGPAVARRVCGLAAEIVSAYSGVVGVAVASAGVIDPVTGAVVSATNTMPGWGGTLLGAMLGEELGLPVAVVNDVHAHGLGEARLGAGRGHDVVLSMAVGTGIGGAVIYRGDVLSGSHYLAGHLGHIHHGAAPNMLCSCGRRGHIEAFCSGSGITAWYQSRRGPSDPMAANGRDLQDLADAGYELAAACFEESAFAVGECLGSVANTVDPSIIVLSGSMTRSGQRWWSALRAGYAASVMDGVADVGLVAGELGSNAPLLGAVVNFHNGQLVR